MKTHRDRLWYWQSFALVAFALPSSACVDAIVGEIAVCEYEGESYTLNEKFSAADGCNTCTCQIDGDVSCSEEGCALEDAASAIATDAGPGRKPSTDAGVLPVTYCKDGAKVYEIGDKFPDADGCNTCVCGMDGVALCTLAECQEPPTGSCKYDKEYAVGEAFVSKDGCNMCICAAPGMVKCSDAPCNGMSPNSDAGSVPGASCGPFSCPTGMGSCLYQGQKYAVGEAFMKDDQCNKCQCVADGLIECTANSCAPAVGCLMGNELFQPMDHFVCADGCNHCVCDGTKWSSSRKACPALPVAKKCAPGASSPAFPAALIYQTGDVLAVAQTSCTSGQIADFDLCFEEPVTGSVRLYVVANGATRSCDATLERVFSLAELRSAAIAVFQQMSGKVVLLGGGSKQLIYQF